MLRFFDDSSAVEISRDCDEFLQGKAYVTCRMLLQNSRHVIGIYLYVYVEKDEERIKEFFVYRLSCALKFFLPLVGNKVRSFIINTRIYSHRMLFSLDKKRIAFNRYHSMIPIIGYRASGREHEHAYGSLDQPRVSRQCA